jgi:HAE1 family hydrophobic/amphiphilic exporter-1
MPLAIGIGTGAEIQAALARVVVGGLLASTFVTLVLIPVAYTTATGWRGRERAPVHVREARELPEGQPAT